MSFLESTARVVEMCLRWLDEGRGRGDIYNCLSLAVMFARYARILAEGRIASDRGEERKSVESGWIEESMLDVLKG
jgi:hypothetical protein